MKIVSNSGPLRHVKYETLYDLMDYAVKGKGPKANKKDGWYANVTFDESLALSKKGWPEGFKDIIKANGIAVKGKVQRVGRKRKPHVYGKGVNLDRYIRHDPRPFIHQQKAPHKQPAVRIGIQVSGRGGFSTSSFENRGACAVSLANALTDAGTPVEIWLYSYVEYHSTKRFLVEVCAKRSGEPIDLDRLTYMAGHASFYRHIWFGLYRQLRKNEKGFSSLDPQYVASANLTQDGGDFYDVCTPYDQSMYYNLDRCKKWAQETADRIAG